MMTLAVYLYAAAYAWVEAADDATDIDAGRPIPHGLRFWITRALRFIVPVCLVYTLWWGQYQIDDVTAAWALACALVGGGAVFAIFHRVILNWHRLLPMTYTSPSNGYDRAWRKVLGHRAGAAMYIVETIIAIAFYNLT